MSKKGHDTKKISITESDNKTKNTLLMNCWNYYGMFRCICQLYLCNNKIK